jgi:hypothetical protein
MKKEETKNVFLIFLVSSILMGIILSFSQILNNNPSTIAKNLVFSFIIIFLSIFSKQVISKKIDLKVGFNFLTLKRYGVSPSSHFKNPVQIGLILPILLAIISGGIMKFLVFFQFDLIKTPTRAAKRYGSQRFSEIKEWDFALVSFYSFLVLMLLAILSNFFVFKDLAKITLLYTGLNLIPFGTFDGSRIFYGSKPLYAFSLIIFFIIWAYYLI